MCGSLRDRVQTVYLWATCCTVLPGHAGAEGLTARHATSFSRQPACMLGRSAWTLDTRITRVASQQRSTWFHRFILDMSYRKWGVLLLITALALPPSRLMLLKTTLRCFPPQRGLRAPPAHAKGAAPPLSGVLCLSHHPPSPARRQQQWLSPTICVACGWRLASGDHIPSPRYDRHNLYAYTIVPVDVALTSTSPGSHVQRSITALVQRLQADASPLIPSLRPDYGPTTLVTGGNLVSITNQPGSVRRPTDCEPVDYSEPYPSAPVALPLPQPLTSTLPTVDYRTPCLDERAHRSHSAGPRLDQHGVLTQNGEMPRSRRLARQHPRRRLHCHSVHHRIVTAANTPRCWLLRGGGEPAAAAPVQATNIVKENQPLGGLRPTDPPPPSPSPSPTTTSPPASPRVACAPARPFIPL